MRTSCSNKALSADGPIVLMRCPSSRLPGSPRAIDAWRALTSASIAMRVAVSRRLVLPGTLPRIVSTTERNQVRIGLGSKAPRRGEKTTRGHARLVESAVTRGATLRTLWLRQPNGN